MNEVMITMVTAEKRAAAAAVVYEDLRHIEQNANALADNLYRMRETLRSDLSMARATARRCGGGDAVDAFEEAEARYLEGSDWSRLATKVASDATMAAQAARDHRDDTEAAVRQLR